jgi:serpin B
MKFVIYSLTVLFAVYAINGAQAADLKPETRQSLSKTGKRINEFSLKLFQALDRPDKNIVISGLSINDALTMVFCGTDGETRKELAQTLGITSPEKELLNSLAIFRRHIFTNENSESLSIKTANGLWPAMNFKINPAYHELMKASFNAAIKTMNYSHKAKAAVDEINQAVARQTDNKIENLLNYSLVNGQTRLILTNSLYFKGLWQSSFSSENNQNKEFAVTDKEKVEVTMMLQVNKFPYYEDENVQAVLLPYKNPKFSLLIAMPRDFAKLQSLSAKLSPNLFSTWLDNLDERKINLELPKFTIKGDYNLNKALQGLGINEAFNPAADFSRLTSEKGIFISAVVHSTFLELTEEGSEAAAATAVVMTRSVATPPPGMLINRPFFFALRENTSGVFLFSGRINNPNQ